MHQVTLVEDQLGQSAAHGSQKVRQVTLADDQLGRPAACASLKMNQVTLAAARRDTAGATAAGGPAIKDLWSLVDLYERP